MAPTDIATGIAPNRGWTLALWAAQILLALMFAMAGGMHAFMAPPALAQMGATWAADAPIWLVRFVGIAELAGAIGIIFPALTRIQPGLTPLAAAGFATIQVAAMVLHVTRGEAQVLPMNLVLLALALFVAWGRTSKAPVTPRS